jgi:NADH:ubiquinone oxidoreductase subunit 2 (subunit N)
MPVLGFSDIATPILAVYALAYVFLVICAACVLLMLSTHTSSQPTGLTALTALATLRLRSVWLLLLVNLAGLPPAFFFGPKLGLLGLFFEAGTFVLLLAVGVGVFLGWAMYFSLGQRLLWATSSLPQTPLRQRHGRSVFWLMAVTMGFGLLTGAVLLDECVLIVH